MDASAIEDVYELSPLQQGILFHSLYDGDAEVYVNQRSFIIEGRLDCDALITACGDTVRANSALRTSFHWEGLDKPLQVVHRDVSLTATRLDWSGFDDHERRLDELMAADLATGFDPATAPLQRLLLVRLAPERHALVWSHHLLLLDGWSVPLFMREVLHRYLSRTAGVPEPQPAPPYRDYIAWLQRQDMDAAAAFWAGALSDTDAVPIAALGPAGPEAGSHQPAEHVVDVSPRFETELRAAAARHGVTLNTLLQAAWAAVQERHGAGRAVTIGVTSSCRPPDLPRIDQTMGLFTNTLPLAVRVPREGDLGDWLRAIQSSSAAIRRFDYTPLAMIRKWAGRPGAEPLFHSLLVFDNYSMSVETGGPSSLSVHVLGAVEKTSEPIVVVATPEPTFTVRLRYQESRLDRHVAAAVLDDLVTALRTMTAARHVEEVAAAIATTGGAASRHVDGPARSYPDADRTIVDLVERQAAATPDAAAVVADDGIVRYADLVEDVRRTAVALQKAGVRPGGVVGICAERSADLVVGVLAALYVGAAYLPLDPSLPSERLAFMVRDAGVEVVWAHAATARTARTAGADRVLTREAIGAADAPLLRARPDDAAYVIYTSGTTGRPKGVVVTHRAIVNRLLWMQETFALTPSDRVLQKTPVGFDVSVWELFWPLITGASVVLARPGGHQDPEYLAGILSRERITIAHFVPSMLALFLDEPAAADLPHLRRVVCSGEALPPRTARRFQGLLPGAELHNLYGPTEAAVDVTWWDCARSAPPGVLPIGEPIANTRAVVLDERLSPVPDGVTGELYLGGVQLARGYLGRAALTARTFVAHPLAGPGRRLYRTGDRVRRLPDGALEFTGRLDHQVKVNGNRIELGEIEQVLATHPAVRDAAVVVLHRDTGPQLAAYVTGASDAVPDPQEVRAHAAQQLPRFMLPATITLLASMPVTHNGKLDRAALPDPTPAPTAPTGATAATATEAAVAAAFREVLDVDDVDVTASFFSIGGNSFDAVRAIRRIDGASVALLGAHPSVRELAAALDGVAAGADGGDGRLLRLSAPPSAAGTLVCVPFGGGSAITYQPLSCALGPDMALVALSLPGHELGGDPGLRSLEEVAREAVEALSVSVDGPISVYGHCAGVGLAVEVVRLLEESGRPVDRLFLGGAYPFYEPGRLARAMFAGHLGDGGPRVDARLGADRRQRPALRARRRPCGAGLPQVDRRLRG